MSIGALWDQLVDAICRPPRDEYSTYELIGAENGNFRINGLRCKRSDLTLVNKDGLRLECSYFKTKTATDTQAKQPCIIYCHCNSGSRRDAEEAVYLLVPHNITVFCLDFAGSGLSEGDYVTLGAREVNDLQVAVEHIRQEGLSTTIGLWGRSMGAVTALLYSQRDPSIAGVVLDSPFSRLTELMLELVEEQKLPIPRYLTKFALGMMRRSVRKRAKFNIDEVSPIDAVPQAFIPALFGHADGDTFVNKRHSERLHAAYAGDKNLIMFDGDHNSVRPQFFYSSALIFLHNVLQCPDELNAPIPYDPREAQDLGRQLLDRRTEVADQAELTTRKSRELNPPWEMPSPQDGDVEQLVKMWNDTHCSQHIDGVEGSEDSRRSGRRSPSSGSGLPSGASSPGLQKRQSSQRRQSARTTQPTREADELMLARYLASEGNESAELEWRERQQLALALEMSMLEAAHGSGSEGVKPQSEGVEKLDDDEILAKAIAASLAEQGQARTEQS